MLWGELKTRGPYNRASFLLRLFGRCGVVDFGGVGAPAGGGTPQGDGGEGGLPFAQKAEKFGELFGFFVGEVLLFSQVGGGCEELGGAVGEFDQLAVAGEDGALALEAPKEGAFFLVVVVGEEHGKEVPAVISSVTLIAFAAIAGVFVGRGVFERERFRLGCGHESG